MGKRKDQKGEGGGREGRGGKSIILSCKLETEDQGKGRGRRREAEQTTEGRLKLTECTRDQMQVVEIVTRWYISIVSASSAEGLAEIDTGISCVSANA